MTRAGSTRAGNGTTRALRKPAQDLRGLDQSSGSTSGQMVPRKWGQSITNNNSLNAIDQSQPDRIGSNRGRCFLL